MFKATYMVKQSNLAICRAQYGIFKYMGSTQGEVDGKVDWTLDLVGPKPSPQPSPPLTQMTYT